MNNSKIRHLITYILQILNLKVCMSAFEAFGRQSDYRLSQFLVDVRGLWSKLFHPVTNTGVGRSLRFCKKLGLIKKIGYLDAEFFNFSSSKVGFLLSMSKSCKQGFLFFCETTLQFEFKKHVNFLNERGGVVKILSKVRIVN